jgi:nucleoside-diphosphate-sugar epimerase
VKLLITGATGFVGQHVVKTLLNLGHEVVATCRSRSKAEKFKWFDQILFIPFEIDDNLNNISVYDYFKKPDVLIHLAWAGLPDFQNLIHLESNLPKHKKFLSNFISSGGKHLTVIGTCLEYGIQTGCLSEELTALPTTSYGIAKNNLRIYLEELQQENNSFIFQWVRLFYMYGPGQQSTSIIPQLAAAIERKDSFFNMSGGEQTRDYLPINKVAEYICKIALQDNVTGIINCCSNEPITVKRLVEDYIKLNAASIQLNLGYYPYTKYEPMHFWGDNSKLKLIK